jgi:hypothetical protein
VEACFCKGFCENLSPLLICNIKQLREGSKGMATLKMVGGAGSSVNSSFRGAAAICFDANLLHVLPRRYSGDSELGFLCIALLIAASLICSLGLAKLGLGLRILLMLMLNFPCPVL